MADEATSTDVEVDVKTSDDKSPDVEIERQSFLDRLGKESSKRKAAEQQAKETAARLAELERAMEERDNAGLPELDRMKRELERAQKRAEEAEQRATQQEQAVERSRRERLITAAAQAANFHDPDDAARYVDLEDIESASDAERAVKRVAKAKKHLVKQDEPQLPGRVLRDGQRVDPARAGDPLRSADEEMARGFLDEINRMRAQSGYRSHEAL